MPSLGLRRNLPVKLFFAHPASSGATARQRRHWQTTHPNGQTLFDFSPSGRQSAPDCRHHSATYRAFAQLGGGFIEAGRIAAGTTVAPRCLKTAWLLPDQCHVAAGDQAAILPASDCMLYLHSKTIKNGAKMAPETILDHRPARQSRHWPAAQAAGQYQRGLQPICHQANQLQPGSGRSSGMLPGAKARSRALLSNDCTPTWCFPFAAVGAFGHGQIKGVVSAHRAAGVGCAVSAPPAVAVAPASYTGR